MAVTGSEITDYSCEGAKVWARVIGSYSLWFGWLAESSVGFSKLGFDCWVSMRF